MSYLTKYKVVYRIRGDEAYNSLMFNKWRDAHDFCRDVKYYAIHARIHKEKIYIPDVYEPTGEFQYLLF